MMTDRELLEAAAKAAGLVVHAGNQKSRDACGAGDVGLWVVDNSTCWNPLTNDGDALRLAVALRLMVDVGGEAAHVFSDDPGVVEAHSGDAAAAVRRAIVRQAAQMQAREAVGAA